MDNSTFAWFALIGFLSPPFIGALLLIGKKDGDPPFLIKGSLKAKVISLISIIGAFSCLIMVLKGFHLWRTWEVPSIDPNVAAKTAARARGRGGIILLAIRFFPQFLVFGYSYWGWQLKNEIKSFPLAWNLKNK